VKGNDMFAESSHADLYAALDELVDKLDRQVGRTRPACRTTTATRPSA
jgi:ribosome-associated translation inhibitor RaiA